MEIVAVPATPEVRPPPNSSLIFTSGSVADSLVFSGRCAESLSAPWKRITYTSSFCATTTFPSAGRPSAFLISVSSVDCTSAAEAFHARSPVVAVATTFVVNFGESASVGRLLTGSVNDSVVKQWSS